MRMLFCEVFQRQPLWNLGC